MGKRGPTPRGDFTNKSAVLSTRIRPDTRAALAAAAERSGRSLSQEIEARLARTFRDDEKIEAVFGSARTFALMRALAAIAGALRRADKPEAGWLDDPFLFGQAVQAIAATLQLYRPAGPVEPPHLPTTGDPMSDRLNAIVAGVEGAKEAAMLLHQIARADLGMPIGQGTWEQHFAAVLREHLGDVAQRPVGRALLLADPTKGEK